MNDLEIRDLLEQAIGDNWNARLVLSDYLQEKGDPRGELITLEYALQNSNGNIAQVKKLRNKLAKKVEQEFQTKFPNIKILDHWNGFPTDIVASPETYDTFNQSEDAFSDIKVRFTRKYDVVKGRYASAVHELRELLEKENNQEHPRFELEDGTSIYRPLTLEESFEARVVNYWTLKDSNGKKRTEKERKSLFNDYQDTCTGIAYQKGTTKFKIDLECKDLITIDKKFAEEYLPINYADYQGKEFEIDESYSRGLTESKFLEHLFYETVIPDKTLRKAVAGIVYGNNPNTEKLGVYLLDRNEIEEDQLRALCFLHLDGGSLVGGRYGLDCDARFLRVAQ